MKDIFGYTAMILGWLTVVLATPVWLIKGIYELIKTDFGFWSVAFSNVGGWLGSLIVGFLMLGIGFVFSNK